MCGKLRDGNTTISAVVPEETKQKLNILVKTGNYRTRSEAAGAILNEAVDEALRNCINQNQSENSRDSYDSSSNDSQVKHLSLDEETFRKLPKTFQIFSKLLEKAKENR